MSASELVALVDEDDRVVGAATRAEMRRHRLLHRCVYILLLDSSRRLFIHRRTSSKDIYPGFWDVAVGGVVAAGEDYDEAATREVEEEVGLVDAGLTRLFPLAYEDQQTRVRGMAYECMSDQPLRLQADEVAEGRWVRSAELQLLTQSESFCADGLAVLERYLSRCSPQTRRF